MPTRRRPDGTDEARARRLRSAEARPRTVRDIPPRPRADETADEARARADDPTPEGQFDRVCRIKYPPHTQPGTAYHVDGSGAPVVFLGHSCEGMAWGATHSRRGDGKQRRYLFSVGGDDPAKRAFEAGGPGRGVARACERLGVPWLSVGLHRQGLPGGNDNRVPRPLTVVITVSRPPAGEGLARISGAAEMLIHRVEKLLRIKAGDIGSTTDARTGRRCRRPNIQVEVIFPPGADTHDPMEPAGLLSHGQETLHPGRSVGVAGGDGPSGSLSCLVQLTMADGRRALHALASHHVLSRGQPDRLAPLGGTTTNASSPSDADCTSMLRALDRTRGDGGLVGRMHRVNAARRAEGRAPAVSDGAVARWEARMADALRAHGVWHALAPARGMGGVVCSSGIVKPAKGQPMLDWALVGLDSTKIPGRMETVNDTPDLEERVKALSDLYGAPNPRETRPSIMAFWNPPAEEVVSLAEIRALRDAADPVFVYLHGRSTAYSVGVLHDVDAIVRTHYARRDDDDDDSDSVPVVSSELVVRNCHAPMPVVAPRLRLPPGPCGVFAGPGDAGAPVRLADGRLVGFVLQGDRASGAGGHVCHVTPAETVLEHVKRVTGAEEVKVVPCWGEGSEVSPGGE